MIPVDFAQVAPMVADVQDRMEHFKPTPLFFYPYLKRVLEIQWKKENPQYPMDIKIPAENKYLLKKEFEPAQVVHLEEPVKMSDGTPMWFENSSSQIWLRFGYDNMDARFLSKQKFDMEFIRATCSATSVSTRKCGVLCPLGDAA